MSLLKRVGRHARANVVAYLALFVARRNQRLRGEHDRLRRHHRRLDPVGGPQGRSGQGRRHRRQPDHDREDLSRQRTNSDIDGRGAPRKLSTGPGGLGDGLTGETSHCAQGTTLHADYEFFDTAALHDGTSENLVAPVSGTYVVSATVEWDPSGTGYRRSSIVSNSGGAFASVAGPPSRPRLHLAAGVRGRAARRRADRAGRSAPGLQRRSERSPGALPDDARWGVTRRGARERGGGAATTTTTISGARRERASAPAARPASRASTCTPPPGAASVS